MIFNSKIFLVLLTLHLCHAAEVEITQAYRASPKLTGPAKLTHDPSDALLNQLDETIEKISTVYMQALFDGNHTPEMEMHMRKVEIDLYDMLNKLYQQERLSDYMRYEDEVTRQMIVYNMLKRLFGYSGNEQYKDTK